MSMNSKLFLIIIFMVVAGGMVGCGQDEAPKKAVVRPVRAVRVADSTQLHKRTFPGRAKGTREVNLSFRVAGPLIVLPNDVVGKKYKKGEIIARIDPRDFEINLRNVQGQLAAARANLAAMRQARPEQIGRLNANVQEAEAVLKRAESEYTRELRIFKQHPGATSQTAIDRKLEQKERAEADLRRTGEELRIGEAGARPEDIAAKKAEITSLQASVTSAKDELSYTYLKTPFDGTVVANFVENFEDVNAKEAIVRLVDTSRIEMVVNIPENLISSAHYVETVFVRFDPFPDLEISAKIKEIGTEASETTRTYPVTLIMDQPKGVKILPGMAGRTLRAEGKLPGNVDEAGIEIPVGAIFSPDEGGKTYVWVIGEQTKTVSRREVKTGQLTDRGIKITDGLKSGEWIATAGVNYLREGQEVRILGEGPEEKTK